MSSLRRLDAFVKTRPDLQQKSVAGGIISILATSVAALLFVGQILNYLRGNPHHSLHLAPSSSVPLVPLEGSGVARNPLLERMGKIPLEIVITFPHVACEKLDVAHDGAFLSTGELEKIHGSHSLTLRRPTTTELVKMGMRGSGLQSSIYSGCTVEGHLHPRIVAGVLSMGLTRQAWAEATTALTQQIRGDHTERMNEYIQNYNVSHYIHKIRFGNSFKLAADQPLENRAHMINNDYGGVAVEHIQVRLIPTLHRHWLTQEQTFQTAVAVHTVQPQTLVSRGVPFMPGLVIAYDFTPLAVHHSDGRDNLLVFISSLVSIVGGVFVTVGLVTGCLVSSAQAVAKKVD